MKELPALASVPWTRLGARSSTSIPYEDVVVPARRGSALGPRSRLRDHHRGLQRLLHLLRRPVHERPRAHAPGRATSWPRWSRRPSSGRREVHLLGQIVNHYQAPDDPTCDFAGTAEARRRVPGVDRIRFASPHPRHVTPRLIEALSRRSTGVQAHPPARAVGLERGARPHASSAHARRVPRTIQALLRELVPRASRLSTDLIVGFPGKPRRTSRTRSPWFGRSGSRASSRSSTRRGPTRSPASACRMTCPSRRSRAASSNSRRSRGAFRKRLLRDLTGREVEVLIDSVSKRRDARDCPDGHRAT